MFVFGIAVAATASLGLLALRVPRIVKALEGFGLWAGLFAQIMGVIEAIRRIATNPKGTFSIAPAAPTVSFVGATAVTSSSVPVNKPAPPREKKDKYAVLLDIEKQVATMSYEDFARDPELMTKLAITLDKFVHRTPDGDLDNEMNMADPIARKARDILAQARDIADPEPLVPAFSTAREE